MTKPQKAGEPSMEEILASIRKIIADDPVSARKTATSDMPPAAGRPAPSQPLAAASRSALDDILGLADPTAKPNMPLPTPPTALKAGTAPNGPMPRTERRPGSSDVPSWLFPAPVNAPSQAAPPPSGGASQPVAQPVPSISIAPEPFFQQPAPESAAKSEASPAQPTPAVQARGLDIGAIVPGRSESAREASVSERKPESGRIPDWMSRPAVGSKPVAEPPPKSLADTTSKPKAGEAALSVAERLDLATERTEIVRSIESIVAGVAPDAATTPPPSEIIAAKAPVADRPTTDALKADRPLPSVGMASVSADVHAPRSALVTDEPAAIPQPASAHPEKANLHLPVAVAEPAQTISRPSVLGARPAKVVPAGDVLPTVLPGSNVRTLEDTVVDLLRPMIRQWLDDNMPRMVEKALRVELAESVKAKVEGKQKH